MNTNQADKALNELGYQPSFKRVLGISDIIIYGLIYMVPMAPIAVFGFIYDLSAGMVALVYIVAAIAMLFSALSYGEMAKQFPVAGSVYSYVRMGLNPYIGCLAGWAILLDYLLLPALLAVFAAIATASMWPSIPLFFWVFLYITAASIINIKGLNLSAKLNKLFLIIQIIVITIFLILVSKNLLNNENQLQITPFFNAEHFSMSTIFAALPIALLSFLGLDAMATANEEVKGGGNSTAKATIIALVAISSLFIIQVYAAALYKPANGISYGTSAPDAFYQVADQVGGKWLLKLLAVTSALIAIFANSIVSQAASSRLLFSMARDRNLPKFLAQTSKFKTPHWAIITIAIISVGLAYFGQNHPKELTAMVTFGALSSYVLLNVAVITHFYMRNNSRRIWLHLVSPILGITVLIYALAHTPDTAKIIGIIWLFVGLIIAYIASSHSNQKGNKILN